MRPTRAESPRADGLAKVDEPRFGVVDELVDDLGEEVVIGRLTEQPQLVEHREVDGDLGGFGVRGARGRRRHRTERA